MGGVIGALLALAGIAGMLIWNHIRRRDDRPAPPDDGDATATISRRAEVTSTRERDW